MENQDIATAAPMGANKKPNADMPSVLAIYQFTMPPALSPDAAAWLDRVAFSEPKDRGGGPRGWFQEILTR